MTSQLEMASPAQGQPTGKHAVAQCSPCIRPWGCPYTQGVPTPRMSIYGLKSQGHPKGGHGSSCPHW